MTVISSRKYNDSYYIHDFTCLEIAIINANTNSNLESNKWAEDPTNSPRKKNAVN